MTRIMTGIIKQKLLEPAIHIGMLRNMFLYVWVALVQQCVWSGSECQQSHSSDSTCLTACDWSVPVGCANEVHGLHYSGHSHFHPYLPNSNNNMATSVKSEIKTAFTAFIDFVGTVDC